MVLSYFFNRPVLFFLSEARLVIFPTSGNKAYKKSHFADHASPFQEARVGRSLPQRFIEKNYREACEISDFEF